MPPFDITQLLDALKVQANLGPMQWGVIGLTIFAVKGLKASKNIPTPKAVRPYLYLIVGVALNALLEWYLGSFTIKGFVAQQAIIWGMTLGLRHLIDAPRAVDPQKIMDPTGGRMGDPRRP